MNGQINKFQAVLQVLLQQRTKEQICLEFNISEAEFDLWEQQFLAAAKDALHGVDEVSLQMAQDSSLWYSLAFNSSFVPEFYSHEYRRIHELLATKQPYGALLQIKDFYEILLKFPILATVSFWLSRGSYDKLTKPYKETIFKILSEKLTLGKWLGIARDILEIQKMYTLDEHEIKLNTILQAVYDLYEEQNIVKWRNQYIGHGALGNFEDESFQQTLKKQLTHIKKHLSDPVIQTLYPLLNIYCKEGNWKISIHDYIFFLNPFMYIENEDVLLFEGYDEASAFVEYLNYKRGKKNTIHQESMKAIFNDLVQSQQHLMPMQDLDFAYKEDVRAFENQLTFLDYIEPSYLTSWITKVTKEQPSGFLYLVMEEGMGKTTLVQAMDELKLNKWKHPNIMCRAVYCNKYFINQIQTLKEDIITCLSKVVINGTTKTMNSYFSFNANHTLDPQEFYGVLTDCFSRLKSEIGKEKLLFVLDGLDELLGTNADHLIEVLSEIPPLPEGMFVLLTAKYQGKQTIKLPNEMNVKTRVVHQNDDENMKLLMNFVKDKLKLKGEEGKRFINNLEDKRMLLIQPYAILRKKVPDASLNSVFDVMKSYMEYMRKLYGEKYYAQLTQLATLLSFSQKALTLDEISFLLTGRATDYENLGLLQDMKYWLTVRKENSTNTYALVKTSVRDAIKKLNFYREDLEAISSRWLILAGGDYSNLDPLPSHIGLLYEYVKLVPSIKLTGTYKDKLPLIARQCYELAETYPEMEQAIKLLKIERDFLSSTEAAYLVSEGYMKMLEDDQALLEMDILFPMLLGQEKSALYFKSIQLQWLLLIKTGNNNELLTLNMKMYDRIKTNKKNALSLLRHALNYKKALSLEHIRTAIESNHPQLVFYYEYALQQIRTFAKHDKTNEIVSWTEVLSNAIRNKQCLRLYDHIILCYLDGLLLCGHTLQLAEKTKTLQTISFDYPVSWYVQKIYIFNEPFILNYYQYFESLQKVVRGIEKLKKEFPLLNEQAFIIMPEFHLHLFDYEEILKLTMYHRIEAERFFKRMFRSSYDSDQLAILQARIEEIEERRFITKKYALNKIVEALPIPLHRQSMTEFYQLLFELPVSEEKFIVGTELLTIHNTMLQERLEAIPEELVKEVHFLYAVLDKTLLPTIIRGRFLFEYARMTYYDVYKGSCEPFLVHNTERKVLDLFQQGFTAFKQAVKEGSGMEDYLYEDILKYIYRITKELKHNGHREHSFVQLLDANEISALRPKLHRLTRVDEKPEWLLN
ncbi:hypothetical protein [Neobacillus niacini]|uniref:hypothetical protein n=1 Tax=Neobacillus niacini TaxID=86668 RepID=UPI0020405FE5|nr:hypothetical protein [Neobacillus niacini]MCM3690947.1 hypothetical protein [Neobacillus niacini]